MNQSSTEAIAPGETTADKRRSTRVARAVPILVRGTDALSKQFKEPTTTVMFNCYGCQYQSKHYVQKNSVVTLEIRNPESKTPLRIMQARVVWVQRPRTYRNLFLVGVEFNVPGNVWGIDSPPKDWFPHPEDEELVVPVYREIAAPEPIAENKLVPIALPTPAQEFSPVAEVAAAISLQSVPVHEVAAAISSQSADGAIESAVAMEMGRMRAEIDAQIKAAIEGAVEQLAERVTKVALENVLHQTRDGVATMDEVVSNPANSSKRRRKAPKEKL